MHLLTGIGIKGNTLPLHIKHAEDKKNKPKKKNDEARKSISHQSSSKMLYGEVSGKQRHPPAL